MKQIILTFLCTLFIQNLGAQTYKTIVDTTFFASVTKRDTINVDINLDGLEDVTFQYFNKANGVMLLYAGSYLNNFISCPGYLDVTRFEPGDTIGPSPDWKNESNNLDGGGFFYDARLAYCWWYDIFTTNGNFVNTNNKFVGIKFYDTSGNIHYGYVEITVLAPSFPGRFIIHSFGYNSIPDDPVVAGAGDIVTNGTLGVSAINIKDNFRIYPTVAESLLSVETPDDLFDNYTFSIINSAGQIVSSIKKADKTSDSFEINVSELDKGMYFLKIQTKNKDIMKRFIKQ